MGIGFQTKLRNYSIPDSIPITAAEIVADIDINDIFNVDGGFILPPDAPHSKYLAKDYGKVVVFHCAKHIHTIKKTYKYLKNNPQEVEKMGIKALPEYASIISFIRLRMGKEKFAEIRNAVTEYIHDNHFFVRDNIDTLKMRRNQQVIYSAKGKRLVKDIKKTILELVKQNKEVREGYSNKDIIRMLLDMTCDENGSIFAFTKRRRNDYNYYARGAFPTSHTVFNRLRDMFASDEAFDKFMYEATQKIISLIKRYRPELFFRNGFNVAIDTISIATWESHRKSPDPNSIMKDAHIEQKGTHNFRFYDCISIVLQGYKFMLWFLPLKEGDKGNKERNVEKLILRALSLVPIGIILMDREYETRAIINLLQPMGLKFIMPVKQSPQIMKIANTMNGNVKIDQRVIGGQKVAKLVIFKKEINPLEYDILAYVTNLEINEKNAQCIKEIYRTRWGIETDFRDLKVFKGLTTSQDTHIRNMFFGTATIIINLWIISNLIAFFLYLKQMPKKPIIDKITFKKYFEGLPEDTS